MFALMGAAAAAGRAAPPPPPPPSLAHALRSVPGRAPTLEACTAAAAGAVTDRGGKLAARFGAAPARPAPPAPPRVPPPAGAARTSGAATAAAAAPMPNGAAMSNGAPKSSGLLAEAKGRLSEAGYKSFIQVLEDIEPSPYA